MKTKWRGTSPLIRPWLLQYRVRSHSHPQSQNVVLVGIRKDISGIEKLQIPQKYIYENTDYKGIRYDSHSRPFQQPSKEALPPKFRDYLNKVEAQYTNSQFGPDPALEQRRSRIRRMLTENSVRSNLATSGMRKSKDGFFGFSAKRFKTLGVQ